jgi:hypothetical protein
MSQHDLSGIKEFFRGSCLKAGPAGLDVESHQPPVGWSFHIEKLSSVQWLNDGEDVERQYSRKNLPAKRPQSAFRTSDDGTD